MNISNRKEFALMFASAVASISFCGLAPLPTAWYVICLLLSAVVIFTNSEMVKVATCFIGFSAGILISLSLSLPFSYFEKTVIITLVCTFTGFLTDILIKQK